MSNLTLAYKKIIDILEKNNLLVEHNIKDSDLTKEIEFISHDSRNIVKNTLFFSKTAHSKEEYLVDAIKKGAACYVSEEKYDLKDYERNYNYIIVNNILRSIAIIAPLYYNYPYKDLNLIGITGTKGKTTVAYFIKNILDEFTKSKTGLSTNIEKYTGKRTEEASMNTPEPCDLQLYFHEARESNIKYFTMEISSQAYKRDRVYGIKFQNGIFLNIGEDHISPAEHKDFEDYLNCKLEFLKNCSNIVINRETDCFDRVLKAACWIDGGTPGSSCLAKKQITLYGSEKVKDECDYYYSDIKKDRDKLIFYITNNKLKYCEKFEIKMYGIFNVENATAAVAMCKTMGIDDVSIKKGLIKTKVSGKMTVFENNGITVIVDYAHNRLSYIKLFESIKIDYPGRKIISVGGTPGNKAFGRRKDFADIVGENSDYVYLTSDDPQYEDTVKICEEIAGYMRGELHEIIPDRVEAITKAVKSARSGDVVALIGKGHENYQKINGKQEKYECDLNIAQRLLSEFEEDNINNKKTKKSREAAII